MSCCNSENCDYLGPWIKNTKINDKRRLTNLIIFIIYQLRYNRIKRVLEIRSVEFLRELYVTGIINAEWTSGFWSNKQLIK